MRLEEDVARHTTAHRIWYRRARLCWKKAGRRTRRVGSKVLCPPCPRLKRKRHVRNFQRVRGARGRHPFSAQSKHRVLPSALQCVHHGFLIPSEGVELIVV
eukprot:6478987-Amphidinium_carterae.1